MYRQTGFNKHTAGMRLGLKLLDPFGKGVYVNSAGRLKGQYIPGE
jgi:hypothetical protein